MLNIPLTFGNEKGFVLPVGFIFLVILALLGTTAVIVTTTDIKIGTNYKSNVKALYVAEAGIEEARERLRGNTTYPIIDDVHSSQAQWTTYIGSDIKVTNRGYDVNNSMHIKTPSIQSDLDYTVTIRHQTDTAGNVLYYGDIDGDGVYERNTTSGENIYIATSYGASGDSVKSVEVEMIKIPPTTVPAALYVGAPTTIQGSSTNIIGTDSCGGADKPGIVTSQSEGSIILNGNPSITGEGDTEHSITYNVTNMNIASIISNYKDSANFAYTVSSATHTASTTPGPGDNWGTPSPGATQEDPSSCGCSNIVYYDTGGTDVQLSGGASGCGILLIEGDFIAHGDFSWYGIIIASGSITFAGGGNKNVTGAVLAGGSADADIIGGNSNIVYCSSAITDQTESQPLVINSWIEKM